jgi:hypothetical protein
MEGISSSVGLRNLNHIVSVTKLHTYSVRIKEIFILQLELRTSCETIIKVKLRKILVHILLYLGLCTLHFYMSVVGIQLLIH